MVSIFFGFGEGLWYYLETWYFIRFIQNGPSWSFTNDLLSDRNFKVRVGNIYSDPYSQEAGVPQGSILPIMLFSLKVNSSVSCLLPDVNCSLYVDDLAIYYSSSHMPSIERRLQQSLKPLV